MQIQSVTWPTVFLEAVKILGPAILALAGTWLALHSQRTLKAIEIEGQSKLRARELLFDIKRQHLTRHLDGIEKLSGTLGSMGATMQDETRLGGNMEMLQFVLDALKIYNVEAIEQDLKAIGNLDENHKQDLQLIRDSLSIKLDGLSASEIYSRYLQIAEALVVLQELRAEILEAMCQDVFREYLPSSNTRPSISPGLRPFKGNK